MVKRKQNMSRKQTANYVIHKRLIVKNHKISSLDVRASEQTFKATSVKIGYYCYAPLFRS